MIRRLRDLPLQPEPEESTPIMTDEGVDPSLLGDSEVDTATMFSDDEYDDEEETVIYDDGWNSGTDYSWGILVKEVYRINRRSEAMSYLRMAR